MYLLMNCSCGNKQVRKIEERFLTLNVYCGKCGKPAIAILIADEDLTAENKIRAQDYVWERYDVLEESLTQLVKCRERLYDFLPKLRARLNF